jgi:hypothetical protein
MKISILELENFLKNNEFSFSRVGFLKNDSHFPYFLQSISTSMSQALVSFKKYMPPPLPFFKVNICPLPLPHFA